MFHVAIDVAKSENPFVPSNLTHFFKFKQFYSLCWHILVNFSSVEFSDLLAQIPWFIHSFMSALLGKRGTCTGE